MSFHALGTLFGIPNRTVKNIFFSVLIAVFQTKVAIPDLLHESTDMDRLYEDWWNDLDPFQKTFFGAFKDPLSKYFDSIIALLVHKIAQ